ncbi:MAG: hypothetical protein QM486_03260 [Flavobacteriaceae bacterium]
MNTKLNIKGFISNLLIAVFILTASSVLTAQKKKLNDLKHFIIIIENTENGIKMQNIQGCAWLDLTFSFINNPRAIDEYGMTKSNKAPSYKHKDANLANFLFTVKKTKKGVVLKGIKGTAWTDLSFSLAKNEKKAIDEYGMTTLN